MFDADALLRTPGAIGVFDSGVGGLSVLRSIRAALPFEPIIYVADSGYAPYGDKAPEWIQTRSAEILDFLIQQGCKAIVIACNTASVIAAQYLRARYTLPIIAIEPAIKPAAQQSKNGVIALMATTRTISSPQIQKLRQLYAADKKLILIPCPGLAEQVESGALENKPLLDYLCQKLQPALEQHADTLILGCTHYPFLLPQIQAVVGHQIRIIEPSEAVAAQVQRKLVQHQTIAVTQHVAPLQLWTSAPNSAPILLHYLQDPTGIVSTLPQHLLPAITHASFTETSR